MNRTAALLLSWMTVLLCAAPSFHVLALPANAASDFGLSNVAVRAGLTDDTGAAEKPGTRVNQHVTKFINIALGILGAIFILLILSAGFAYMRALGNPKQIALAKDTIQWAIVGMAVVLISYGIVHFVITQISVATVG